ncbi:hypothetical protein ACFWWT_15175 [Streptomyces sp. NPDC058676]|uniref:hypothetical protein n=1 Tax=unclassified Streptomyces TaxID=2593676 RepID=UPI003659B721
MAFVLGLRHHGRRILRVCVAEVEDQVLPQITDPEELRNCRGLPQLVRLVSDTEHRTPDRSPPHDTKTFSPAAAKIDGDIACRSPAG